MRSKTSLQKHLSIERDHEKKAAAPKKKKQCYNCNGSGRGEDGNRACEVCNGTGFIPAAWKSKKKDDTKKKKDWHADNLKRITRRDQTQVAGFEDSSDDDAKKRKTMKSAMFTMFYGSKPEVVIVRFRNGKMIGNLVNGETLMPVNLRIVEVGK